MLPSGPQGSGPARPPGPVGPPRLAGVNGGPKAAIRPQYSAPIAASINQNRSLMNNAIATAAPSVQSQSSATAAKSGSSNNAMLAANRVPLPQNSSATTNLARPNGQSVASFNQGVNGPGIGPPKGPPLGPPARPPSVSQTGTSKPGAFAPGVAPSLGPSSIGPPRTGASPALGRPTAPPSGPPSVGSAPMPGLQSSASSASGSPAHSVTATQQGSAPGAPPVRSQLAQPGAHNVSGSLRPQNDSPFLGPTGNATQNAAPPMRSANAGAPPISLAGAPTPSSSLLPSGPPRPGPPPTAGPSSLQGASPLSRPTRPIGYPTPAGPPLGLQPQLGPQMQSGLQAQPGLQPQSGLQAQPVLQPQRGLQPQTGLQPQAGPQPQSGLQTQQGLRSQQGLPPPPGPQSLLGHQPPPTAPNVGAPPRPGAPPMAGTGGRNYNNIAAPPLPGGSQFPGSVPPSVPPQMGQSYPPGGRGMPGSGAMGGGSARPPLQNGQREGGWQSVNGALQNLSLSRGFESVDLLQNRHILPEHEEKPPRPKLTVPDWNERNCSPDIFRCTLTKIPENDSVLKKSRLPLGVVIHPFKDMNHLPVIQCATIVRCRQCRTYINPFVTFIDSRRWRCNVCYRVNEVPEDFLYDPVSQSYGDPSRRPECQSSTIEFIAPSEYMLRPPQPAVYLFILDVSHQAMETGYVDVVCDVLLELLDKLPGDARTQVGFLTYDRSLHFYAMPEGASQPTQLTVSDIDDVFLPSPSDLLVNLHSCRSLIEQLLEELPNLFKHTNETQSALGAALNAAYKLLHPTGGRVSVFQVVLPNVGPGSLRGRETSGHDVKGDAALLGPETDFYKRLALECSGQQIAVDLFTLSTSYVDLATLAGISRFSGGQVSHFPSYHLAQNTTMADKFEHCLRRYLTRKIGFEAVMRLRCTRGIVPTTFHGHFFVRSTDLLALPNVNPDAGFGVQLAIEEELRDTRQVVMQAALLYTSSKGERRIRVHTLCLPVAASVSEVINACDQQAVVAMLAKFASERAVNGSLSDAKEGLVVSCVDAFETYKTYSSMGSPNGLLISPSLRLMPLYVLATLRSAGFRPGQKLDDRSFCFSQLKTLPLVHLMPFLYPELYRVDELTDENALEEHLETDDGSESDSEAEEARNNHNEVKTMLVPQPPRLPLSFEHVSATGLYLMDVGDTFYLYVTRGLHQFYLERLLGVTRMHEVDETMTSLPELPNPESRRLRNFVNWKSSHKAYMAPLRIIREDGKMRHLFIERMIEDRAEPGSLAYFEFLQHLRQQIK